MNAHWITTLAAALLTSSAAFADNPYPADWFWGDPGQRARHDAMVGKPAPLLHPLTDWVNGELRGKDVKGKIIVVDFWATWCGPCIGAIPHNNELAEKYAESGVIILGVCSSSGQEKMEQVAREHNVVYPMARDRTQKIKRAWNVMWWPTYAVVDRQGVVRAVGLKPSAVERVVEDLLSRDAGAPSADADGDVPAAWLEGNAETRARLDRLDVDNPPALEVTDWHNSEESLDLKDLRGKVVLLDFWATWCGPCIRSIPHTNQMQAKYADEGLVVIGVCATNGAEDLARIAEQHKIAFTIAADIENKTKNAYMVNGYPDYYLIDRQGRLRVADCRNNKVEEAVVKLLAEPYEPPHDDEVAGAEQASREE